MENTVQATPRYIVRNVKTGKIRRNAIDRSIIYYTDLDLAQKHAEQAYRDEYLSKGRAGKRVVEAV